MKNVLSRLSRWCNEREWMILLLILVFVLRLPSLFAPHHYGDEEIYFVMGRAWRAGLEISSEISMYSHAFDHKPPLIYIIAGIAKSVFWFRTILLAWMLLHTYLFFNLAKSLWSKDRPRLAYLSSLIFVILTSWPLLEGNIANAELFMMMPITASLLLLSKAKSGQYFRYLVAGLVAGIGLLFKVPVIFDFMALVIYFMAFEKKSFMSGVKSLVRPEFWLLWLGFLLPIVLSVVNYQLKGHGEEYIRAAILVNFGYVSAWKAGGHSFDILQSGLLLRGVVLGLYTLMLYLVRKKLDKRFVLVCLWFGFSLFGALLSARPYPHYLQQPAVPFSLLVPFIFAIESVMGWIIVAVTLVIIILVQNNIGFWGYPTVPIYYDFFRYITNQISHVEYRNTFPGAKMNYAVADYLNERMDEKDKLYIWSSDVAIYNLTDKLLSGGKYMVNFHVSDWNAWDEVISNLENNKPTYILILPNNMKFEALADMLTREYLPPLIIEGVSIYRRSETK